MLLRYSVQLDSPLGFAVERQHVTLTVKDEAHANAILDLVALKGTILEVSLV
jgi:hypothetical protein